mgnify:CR=1 FL=1
MREEERNREMVIDLGANRRGELNEIFLRMFGRATQWLMKAMFGDDAAIPVRVKGNKKEIESFSRALGKEKKYMKSAAKYGLNNPKTYKNKYELRKATANFERTTGLKWPFKG